MVTSRLKSSSMCVWGGGGEGGGGLHQVLTEVVPVGGGAGEKGVLVLLGM